MVTGIGAVTPFGLGVQALWSGCVSGRSAITQLDPSLGNYCRAAGSVPCFAPLDLLGPVRARRTSRFQQFALVAAREALEDSGRTALDPGWADPMRVGVALGTGSGDYAAAVDYAEAFAFKGGRGLDPSTIIRALPDMAAALISIDFGAKGPISTTVAACASSTIAIGQAMQSIRDGSADVMICGGTEAWLHPFGIASFAAVRALSTRDCPPEEASWPFDARRDGFVPSEGAAVLVLEEGNHAAKRGARIYAELAGFGHTADAHHLVAPAPDGVAAEACIRSALADAGLEAGAVDYINAHGTSTPLNDECEAGILQRCFPSTRPLISSTKSAIGHTLGASGAIESAVILKAIQHQMVPPSLNLLDVDPPSDLNFAREPTAHRIDVALKDSFAFGGANAGLVFRRI